MSVSQITSNSPRLKVHISGLPFYIYAEDNEIVVEGADENLMIAGFLRKMEDGRYLPNPYRGEEG